MNSCCTDPQPVWILFYLCFLKAIWVSLQNRNKENITPVGDKLEKNLRWLILQNVQSWLFFFLTFWQEDIHAELYQHCSCIHSHVPFHRSHRQIPLRLSQFLTGTGHYVLPQSIISEASCKEIAIRSQCNETNYLPSRAWLAFLCHILFFYF